MFRAVSLMASAVAANAAFQVSVDGVNTDCVFRSQTNHYGTRTKTATKQELWKKNTYDGKHPNNYDLMYQRADKGNATGGRCQTSSSSAIGGPGTFEAEIYIHSNVRASTGVFTIAAMPEKNDIAYELDLFVINLADNQIKSGRPYHTQVFKISDFVKKWVKVTMVKRGGSCTTSFSDASSGVALGASAESVSCNLSSGPNHVVVNVRARDGRSDAHDHSFVSVKKVSWTSALDQESGTAFAV